MPEEHNAVLPFIAELDAMQSNVVKVNAIVRYVCERMTYGYPNGEIYTRVESQYRSYRYAMFLDPPPVKGVCADYARAVRFLCILSGVPEVMIESAASNHSWNAVYANGQWWYIDATNEDIADLPIPDDKNVLFPMDKPNLPYSDENHEQTKARMELFMPGTT
jgi:transglutaminase-like putative cysteine protease